MPYRLFKNLYDVIKIESYIFMLKIQSYDTMVPVLEKNNNKIEPIL